MKRKDGIRVKNLHGMEQILIDLKPLRCDSDVYIDKDLDVTNLVKYVERIKKTDKDITYFHVFVAAIAKLLYNRNKLNRFVANRHVYEHNDIVISFVAKVAFEDKSEEIMVLIPIEKDDNLKTISIKIKDKIDGVRKRNDKKKGANNAIDVIGKLPNIIRVPLMGIFKWLDDKGMLPSSLTNDNLYYSSALVTNLGSIGCGAIYHNITNFGTCSSITAIGEIKDKEIINKDGKKEIRKLCDFGINFDERVADGFYLIKSIKLLQYIFDNPKLLEEDMSKIIDMSKEK